MGSNSTTVTSRYSDGLEWAQKKANERQRSFHEYHWLFSRDKWEKSQKPIFECSIHKVTAKSSPAPCWREHFLDSENGNALITNIIGQTPKKAHP